jgi:hypothetical protein
MKKYILPTAILVVTIFSVNAYACSKKGETRNPVAKLSERLDLSDEQTAKVKTIFEENRDACEEKESRKEHHTCMEAIKDSVDSALKEILSDEQMALFEEMQSRKREHHGRHRR